MPVIKCSEDIKRFTNIDNYGKLRSYVQFECIKCTKNTIQRSDEFKRRGTLCKQCKIKQNSAKELETKNLELVCAANYLSQIKRRYLKKGLTSNLSSIEVLHLCKDKCNYCGDIESNCKLYKQKYFQYLFKYNGIDRVDSSKGYIRGNVVSCCKKCNLAKSDMRYDEFINHITKIYKNIHNASN